MTQSDGSSTVQIDLTKDDIDLSAGELQRDGGIRLRDLIASQLQAADVSYKKIKPTAISRPRIHRAILVEGGRGSGKTTFLLSNLERLSKSSKQGDAAVQELAEIARDVHVLPMVDPTLIEAKDNIIIIIVQMIGAAIDDIGGRNQNDGDATHDLDKAREELAEGLSMLDGIGQKEPYGNQWEDAYWVMSEGLRKAQKGRDFERKFNLFLEKALGVLDKKAFVLAFDDVDTNFKHGHLILETIRKYLTSPRLILILSGDLDLYGRLIRGHIYETFGQKILQHDAAVTQSGGQDIQTAVRELEEQYLLKIVPPQNRIRMLPLGGLAVQYTIIMRSPRSSNELDASKLPRWIAKRVRAVLGERYAPEHPFAHVIWREHMRLVLGYLRALDLAIDESATDVPLPDPKDLRSSRSAVVKVFETRLRMAGVPSDLLDTHDFNVTLQTVFNWIANQQEPATLVRFGTPGNSNDAIVLHCLALAIAQGLDKSGNGLKALFAMALPAVMLKRPILASPDRKRQVVSYLWNQATPLLAETTARISAVDRFRSNQTLARQRASSFGSVGLAGRDSGSLPAAAAIERVYYDSARTKKGPISWEELESASKSKSSQAWLDISKDAQTELQPRFGVAWFTIEDLLDKNRCEEFGGILNLIFFKRYSERGEIFRSISALSLLAVIAELLLRNDWTDLDALYADTVIPAFGSEVVGETRGPLQTNEDSPEDGEPLDDGPGRSETDEGPTSPYGAFVESMREWHAFASDPERSTTLSPSQMGTLATRIHDDLLDLDGEVRSSWGSGDILHRQITNILNAIIAETSSAQGRKESPKTSDQPLINALYKKDSTLHPLAVIVLSCPLVWCFLRPASDGDLVSAARTALTTWRNSTSLDISLDKKFETWITAPEIKVKISTVKKNGNQRKVVVKGFFDLLNVVPRYADDGK